jgi:hypothetical protein
VPVDRAPPLFLSPLTRASTSESRFSPPLFLPPIPRSDGPNPSGWGSSSREPAAGPSNHAAQSARAGGEGQHAASSDPRLGIELMPQRTR